MSGPIFRDMDATLLRQIIDRAGVAIELADFVAEVQKAFLESRPRSLGDQLVKAFRDCPSFEDFRGALARAQQLAPSEPSVLVIGAGEDVPGRDSQYAAAIAREVFGQNAHITRLDLTPATIYGAAPEPCDVVVTHSLPHYFFDQEGFYRFIRQCTHPGGCYVMGNEPNRRFWSNAEVQRAFEEKNASETRLRALRQYANPRFYASKAASVFGVPASESDSFERNVNMILRQRLNLRGNLTLKELNRITDPFFPDELPGDHPLGGNGIDWETEVPVSLPDFKVEWIASARHLGKQNPNHLAPKWQKRNAELKAKHPMDGNVFSALWRRER